MSDLWLSISAWRASKAFKDKSQNDRLRLLAELLPTVTDPVLRAQIEAHLQKEVETLVQDDQPLRAAGITLLFAFLLLIVFGAIAAPRGSEVDDVTFFSGVHLGMTIQAAEAYYHKLGNVAELGHSDAPAGEEQVDFRTATAAQRRVYVYYQKADNKIVSVSYVKWMCCNFAARPKIRVDNRKFSSSLRTDEE